MKRDKLVREFDWAVILWTLGMVAFVVLAFLVEGDR